MAQAEEFSRLAEAVSEALKVPIGRARRLLESRSTRILRYRDIKYVAIRRDIGDHYEGTSILIHEPSGEYRLVEGYPHILRVLLLSKALPRHFIDDVIVEEKMDGYNVRVVRFRGEIYALTRGGYICPYTTSRMRRKYGKGLERLFDEIGDEAVVAGEVVGMENPYTRYYYPEAPDWDFFVFDIFKGHLDFFPVDERRALVAEYGLRNVKQLGVVPKEDWESVLNIVKGLEALGREGVVLKDPQYRVYPLKYTTSYINTNDIKVGMNYPFDEGHTFIFPRVLRQMFKAVEEQWSEERLREEARKLGEAILLPAVMSILKYVRGEPIVEEFTLSFESKEEMEDFIAHAAALGVPMTLIALEIDPTGKVRARLVKHKKTEDFYKRIFRTGLSPLD